jgi:hypothetical protein
MNKHRRIYSRPMLPPSEPAADERLRDADVPAESTMVVQVEVPATTAFDDLTDTEWSAFMGLR